MDEARRDDLKTAVEQEPRRSLFAIGIANHAMSEIQDELWESLHSTVLGSGVMQKILNTLSEMIDEDGFPEGCEPPDAFVEACRHGNDPSLLLSYLLCFMLKGQWGRYPEAVYIEEDEARYSPSPDLDQDDDEDEDDDWE